MYKLFAHYPRAAAFFAACSVSFAVNASPAEQTPSLETHRVAEAWVATVPPREEPSSWGNVYMSGHIGFVYLPEMDFAQDAGITINTLLEPGYSMGAAVGYKFPFGLRLETEVSYRMSEINHADINGSLIFLYSTGYVTSVNAMLNAWYEIDFLPILLGDWAPYFGAGVGYAKFSASPSYLWRDPCECEPAKTFRIIKANDTALVWQTGVGLAYKYSDDIQFSIDYRFLKSFGELVFHDSVYLDPFKTDYQTHSLFFGFRGTF